MNKNPVKKVSLKEKVMLVLSGIIVSFVLLEVVLRIGGFFYILMQKKNNLADIGTSSVRILCIGESTTALGGADSYPAQLETMLNEKSGRRFKVINEGMISKTSRDILDALPYQIKKYQPHLIISMVGINDKLSDVFPDGWAGGVLRTISRFRTAHFFRLLKDHLKAKWGNKVEPVSSNSGVLHRKDKYQQAKDMLGKAQVIHQKLLIALTGNLSEEKRAHVEDVRKRIVQQMSWILVEMGREARLRQDYALVMDHLQTAINYKPSNYGALVEYGRCLKEQGECPKAVYFFNSAVQQHSQTLLAEMEMAECLDKMEQHAQAAVLYKKILNADYGDNTQLDSDIAKWFVEHDYTQEADKALKMVLEQNPEDYDLNKVAVEFYTQQGRTEETALYKEKVASLARTISSYLPGTVYNYNEIVRIANVQNIPVIAMQYPTRSVKPLQRIFWLHQPVMFIENKENFETALSKHNYFELFSDSFAGDFGHCTRKGNELIAENLVPKLLDILEISDKL